MAYDPKLAARIRDVLCAEDGLTEKTMFGGIAFLLHGNMCVGVINDDLVARLSPEAAEAALDEDAEGWVRPMDFTGRPMRGWLYVNAEGTRTKARLKRWVQRCVAFAGSLPPKTAKKKTVKKKTAKKTTRRAR